MSFLGIGFLIGLVGIILPLAIHFFGKRRKIIQPWGAMRFLDEAKPSWKRRTLRLQDLLVLLARIGAVALLALAFARPVLKVPLPPENGHELILIVDRSPSAELGENSGNHLADEIFRFTSRTLESLPAETRIQLFVNGSGSGLQNLPPESGKPFNEPRNQDAWLRELKARTPATDTLDWAEAIREVLRFSDLPAPISRQVLIVADAAKHGWPGDLEIWSGLAEEANGSSIFLVPVGLDHPGRRLPNLSVDRLVPDQQRVQTGKQITLRATITNRGTAASSPTPVRWKESAESSPVAEDTIPRLEPGASHEVIFKKAFPVAGPVAIQLEIGSTDSLDTDNVASNIVEVVDRIPVAVFIDVPPDRLVDSNSRFAAWTFAAAAGHPDSIAFGDHPVPVESGKAGESDPFFNLKWMTPNQLTEIDPENFAVVVWSVADYSLLPEPALFEKLETFVSGGGSLWLRPPFKVDPAGFNAAFFPHEYGLSPAGIAASQRIIRNRDEGSIGLRPPPETLSDLFSKSAFSSLDELQVTRHLALLDPLPISSRVLLEFEGGKPFLMRRQFGKGEVMLSTLDTDPGSGNLAACVGYVPFVREMLWQLASSHSPQRNFIAGDSSARDLLKAGDRIRNPRGEWLTANLDELNAPGLYWIESPGESSLTPISLGGIPEESETGSISPLDLDRLERIKGIKVLDPDRRADIDDLSSQFVRSDSLESSGKNYEEREIRAWLLVALLGFLVLEVLLAHHLLSRRRKSLSVA